MKTQQLTIPADILQKVFGHEMGLNLKGIKEVESQGYKIEAYKEVGSMTLKVFFSKPGLEKWVSVYTNQTLTMVRYLDSKTN